MSEATEGKFQIGGTAISGGSGSNAKVFFDNITLLWTDLLQGARDALQAEIDKAKECDASEGLADAIAAAESVLASATTAQELTDALAALQAADKDALLRKDNGLTNASATNGLLTSFVVNGTFDSNVNGWNRTGGFQNNALASNQQGDFTVPFWENWNGSAKANKMYQTANNVPNGTYKLKIAAFVNTLADPNESQYVFANNDKVYLTTGNPTFYEVWTVVTTNTIEYGLEQTTATANWMGIDNVSLTYYGAGDVVAAAQAGAHKTDWDDALAAAQAALNNADYANVTGSERTALQTEINKPEPTSADAYDQATAALRAATNVFTAAKNSYDALAAINGNINVLETLQYADPTKKPSTYPSATSAADADAHVALLTTALRAYYESHALAENVEGALNVTSSITNASNPTNNDGWTWTGNKNNPASNEPWTDADGTNTHSYFDGGNWGANSWTTTMEQTVSLPAGRYLLTAKGRAAVNTTMTLAADEVSEPMSHVGSSGNIFDRGWGDTSVEFQTDGSGVVIKVTASSQTVHEWFSVGDFRLMLLETDFTALQSQLAATVAAAEAVEYTIPSAVWANISDVIDTYNQDYDTAAEYLAAIEAINNAVSTYATADITNAFSAYLAAVGNAETIMQVETTDATAQATAADALSTTLGTIDMAANAATTVEAINTETAKINPAILVYVKDLTPADPENAPFDLTFMITNPSFDDSYNGWSYNTAPNPGNDATQRAAHAMEYYQKNFDIYQQLTGMPTGLYRLKVKAFQRPGFSNEVVPAYVNAEDKQDGTANVNAFIYVNGGNEASQLIKNAASPMLTEKLAQGLNESQVEVEGVNYYLPNDMVSSVAYFDEGYYENETEIVATTNSVKFGFRCDAGTGNGFWTIFDDFRLYYAGQLDLSVFEEQLAAVVATAQELISHHMSVAASLGLSEALETYNKPWSTSDQYTTAIDVITGAIETARTSIAAYERAKEAIDLVNDVLDNTNVYTADAYEAFYTNNFAVFTQKYNNGELTDDEATQYYGQTFGTGVRTANTIDDLLLSAWGVIDYTGNPYINTWSTEGNNDGSEFKTPFFEQWVESGSIAARNLTATIEGLTPGKYYDLTALVRVSGNDKVAGSITLQVGEGEAVDVTAGERVGDTDRYLGSFRARGTADADGRLTITVAIAASSNISWLAYKNLKYAETTVDDVRSDYNLAVAAAEALLIGAPYSNVRGMERSNLSAAISEEIEQTVEAYVQQTQLIDRLAAEFVAAKENYDAYSEALASAQSYVNEEMFDADKTALNSAIEANALPADATSSDLPALTEALNAAVAEAVAAITRYNTYNTICGAIADKTNVNISSLIANLGFEEGNLTGWTSVDGGNIADNNNFSGKTGTYFVERWKNGVALGEGSLTHDLFVLPNGLYSISVNAQNIEQYNNAAAGTGYFFCINEKQVAIGAADTYTTLVKLDAETNDVTLKFLLQECSGNWVSCDDIQIVYVGADFPDVAVVEGKMNNDVASAQTAAKEAFEASKTSENYQALLAAVAAAEASKAAYAQAAQALSDANALKTAHNFASATATATFTEAIAAVQTAYDEGTLADADANNAAAALGVAVTGWHAGANGAAVKYMNDAFGLNDFDAALYVNTWSTEGSTDGSGFVVPFYEYYTSNDQSLAAKTWTATLTGLETGQYTVSAKVRARIKDGADDVVGESEVEGETVVETAVSQAAGLTLDVNGEGTVDFGSDNELIDASRFRLADCEVTVLVKDGTLRFNVNIADGNNISWLSFKNVKYVKVRDLTPEEAAVAPTAIAFEPVTLTATENTVTLAPVFTPENATTTVTWTSSDETVATVTEAGVVTGVAPGTAVITATSTIDTSVSGTCVVTVTYPETILPESNYTNSGATRFINTLGENIIKNGVFEYPDAFYGWTSANNFTSKITSANFSIRTDEEGHKYLVGTQNTGATGAGSLGTAWEIEEGKTYQFAYDVKKEKDASDYSYLKTSLTNTPGTETSAFATPTSVGTDWTTISYTFTNTEGYRYIQVDFRWLNGQWGFRNFYLTEVSQTTEGNVDYATAVIPTANIGEDAFQYSQVAVDAAEDLVQGEATVEDVQAAYDALTTVNEPEGGQLFNVVLTYDGWTYDQKAMTYIANGRNDAGLYNIQYKEAANVNLAQAFTFTPVEGSKNGYKMSQIDADGAVRYISTGVPYGGNTAQIRTTTDESKALVVTVIPTATEGKWNLRNTEAGQYIGSQDAGVYTVNSHIDFNIVETQKPSITINTTAAGWGTTVLPFVVTAIPDGVKVYSCAEVVGSTLTLEEVTALEANKPYIIEGAWSETLTGDAQGTQLQNTVGLLTGVYAGTPAQDGWYVLQKNDGKVGFYRVNTETAQPTVGANRAYLTVPEAEAGARAFYLGGETTGINALEALAAGEAQIFNASGVQQPRLAKGLNIIVTKDGKTHKVMVK